MLRFLGFLTLTYVSGLLAWLGWHLPPPPRCTLAESTQFEPVGFSDDGLYFAAKSKGTIDYNDPIDLVIWNANSGQRLHRIVNGGVQQGLFAEHYMGSGWDIIVVPEPGKKYHGPEHEISPIDGSLRRLKDEKSRPIGHIAVKGRRMIADSRYVVNLATTPPTSRPIPAEMDPKLLSRDGRTLICDYSDYGRDRSVVIWDCESHREVARMRTDESMMMANDGRFGAVVAGDEFHIWDLDERTARVVPFTALFDLRQNVNNHHDVDLAPGGRRLLMTGGKSRHVYVVNFDLPNAPTVTYITTAYQHCSGYFIGDGSRLLVTTDHGIECWNVSSTIPCLEAKLGGDLELTDGRPKAALNQGWAVGKPTPDDQASIDGYTHNGLFCGWTWHFSNDSRWVCNELVYGVREPDDWRSTLLPWLFPPPWKIMSSYAPAVVLADCQSWQVLGHWHNSHTPHFAPDNSCVAIKQNFGPIAIWDLPPTRQRWLRMLMMAPSALLIFITSRWIWRRSRLNPPSSYRHVLGRA